jgi:alpha-ribazole phosphatase
MANVTHIALLRHGETQGGSRLRGRLDDPLTAMGWEQMWTAVGQADRKRTWDAIIASPLARCADFAQALSERQGIPLHLDRRLVEMDFGAWEGQTAADLMATDAGALGRFWADPLANTPPGGETLMAFASRVLAAWRDILDQEPSERLLVIGHGGVIRVILCQALGHPLGQLLELDVGHASVTCLQVERTTNQAGHHVNPRLVKDWESP